MKSHYEIQYERELRKKEKEIKIFNEELKSSEQLLNNEIYLFQNMSKIRLKLKQLPKIHLDNVLLITEFFKSKRDTINFKYIKPEILNNQIFLSLAIKDNPEIYFLMSEENKKIFKNIVIKNDKEYLKYLNKEDYNSPEIKKDIALHLMKFNESLSCIPDDVLKNLSEGEYSKNLEDNILRLNKEQCGYLKVVLNKYMEEKKRNGKSEFNTILNKNPYLYIVLDKELYKDEESKKLIIGLTGKYHDLFPYLPKEWKKDTEIISKIINDKSETEFYYQYHGMSYHNNVKDVAIILNEYDMPEKFIKENYNEKNMKFIRNVYEYLTESWREQEIIIKSLFKERDNFEIDINYCRSIPNTELSEKLVEQLKTVKVRDLENVGDMLEKIVTYHYLKEKLIPKNTMEKKLKI